MRIGILTFHNALNYGAVLQAYATQVFLTEMGHDVEIIDYENPFIKKVYKRRIKLSPNLKVFLVSIIVFIFNTLKVKAFSRFVQRYLNLSIPIYNEDDLYEKYDLIFIGSDQVWNPKQTGGFDKYYWGNFKHTCVLAAWAASSKENAFSEDNIDLVSKYLENFDFISVREHTLKTQLEKITMQDMKVLIDPTLMLAKEKWLHVCHPVPEKKYVLVYAMSEEKMVVEKAKVLAAKRSLNLIVVNPYTNAKISRGYKQFISPLSFISYIKKADAIVTSSFHGTAFSIIFEKDFYCVIKKGESNQRIESLLETLGLKSRIVDESEERFEKRIINYEDVGMKRRKEIEKCEEYVCAIQNNIINANSLD